MKIAIASNKGTACQHFGHCELFTIYDVEEKQIFEKKEVANPGHRPGFLPGFLAKLGVNVIISGGMGAGAIDLFNANNIAIITGVSGDVDDIIGKWIIGELESTGSICNEHQHYGEC